jgi:hypothetical protein
MLRTGFIVVLLKQGADWAGRLRVSMPKGTYFLEGGSRTA